MPKGPEGQLYKRLKENLKTCHITRIESRVNLGIPDCLIALQSLGKFVMVELKVVKKGLKVNLSPHQIAFHLKHAELKCPTFVLVEYHPALSKKAAGNELLLYSGAQAAEVFEKGVTVEPLHRWVLPRVDWSDVCERLGAV